MLFYYSRVKLSGELFLALIAHMDIGFTPSRHGRNDAETEYAFPDVQHHVCEGTATAVILSYDLNIIHPSNHDTCQHRIVLATFTHFIHTVAK